MDVQKRYVHTVLVKVRISIEKDIRQLMYTNRLDKSYFDMVLGRRKFHGPP